MGVKWRRQMPIDRYFADFACKDLKLVIELDGDQHVERAQYDAARTRVIEACGYQVIRFGNLDVLTNLEGVAASIDAAVRLARAAPSPSHSAFAEWAPPSPEIGRGVLGADHD
jgi:very-short-patch-repair endonuclease